MQVGPRGRPVGSRGLGGKAPRGRAKPVTTSGVDESPSGSSDQFVITESTHICGYPECNKRFRFKHDLLRHQTKYHGRQPLRARKADGTGTTATPMSDDSLGYSGEFVIIESTHICGYPQCDKRFRFKHDLLRHQTKYHGRQPLRSSKMAGSGGTFGE